MRNVKELNEIEKELRFVNSKLENTRFKENKTFSETVFNAILEAKRLNLLDEYDKVSKEIFTNVKGAI